MSYKGSGAKLLKQSNSLCVVNIMVPPEIAEPIQNIRTNFIPDARCGPHFSFLDPFVTFENYERAAQLLAEALRDFPPFQMRLKKVNYFQHKSSYTIYLEPETTPPNAIQDLVKRCLEVFPQCDDQLKKSKNNVYVAHCSIAKAKSEPHLKSLLSLLQTRIPDTTCTVDAIYLLHRTGPDPFRCAHEVCFGNVSRTPYYGVGSPGDTNTPEQESQIGRSLVISKLTSGTDNKKLLQIFESQKIQDIERVEVTQNPDSSLRTCGVVQFTSHQAMLQACKSFKPPKDNLQIIINPMAHMMAPGPIGGAWSLSHAQKILKEH